VSNNRNVKLESAHLAGQTLQCSGPNIPTQKTNKYYTPAHL